MLNIVISLLTFVLILTSLFLVLVILMQRANSNAGMGSAFGGGVTESAFGAETSNILARATKWAAFAFFILSLVLYLLYMSRISAESRSDEADLPDIPVVQESIAPFEQSIPAEESIAVNVDKAVAEAGDLADQVEAEAASVVEDAQTPPTP